MMIFTKILSVFLSLIMAFFNLFGFEQRPEFVLGENVNSNAQEVLAVYNAAVIKTDESSPEGVYYFDYKEADLGNLNGAVFNTLFRNMFNGEPAEIYDVPGKGALKADDVTSAKSSTENGRTTVIIEVKDQTEGAYSDGENGGPVSRAMGTADNLAAVLGEIGNVSGLDTIEIKYTDCRLACIIDDASGEILFGEWTYTMTMTMGEVTIYFGETPVEISDVSVTIGYTVEI